MPQKKTSAVLNRTTTFVLLTLLALAFYFPLGCSVAASKVVASSIQKEQTAQATGVISAQFFGMVVRNSATQPAVVTGARRLWDSGVSWAALEPAQGSFTWTTLDAEVAAAQLSGAQITLTLGMTPQWASSQPGLPSSYGAGATAMPANLADWDAYVTAVVLRYRGRIHAYDVWNAPENTAYWSGVPAQMGENMAMLAAHTASIVHGFDSAALVVSPSLSPTGLAAFLMAGGGSTVDIIGSSLGSLPGGEQGAQAPEGMVATLQALRQTMVGTSADGKPVWNEQESWMLPQGGLSTDTQAAYVARALLLNAGFAVQRIQWYAWDENNAGALALTDAQAQPTEAAVAYGLAESWIEGASMNGCASTAGGVWTCQIVRGGKTEWIVWSTQGSVNSSSLGASTMTDLQGNVSAVGASGSVSVGESPVLLQ